MQVQIVTQGGSRSIEVPDGTEVWAPRASPVVEVCAELERVLADPDGCSPLAAILAAEGDLAIALDPGAPNEVTDELLDGLAKVVEAAGRPASRVRTIEATAWDGGWSGDPGGRDSLLQHDAHDPDGLIFLRRYPDERRGGVYLNGAFMRAAKRLAVAVCAPHWIAGYSGASTTVFPGLAGAHNTARSLNVANVLHPASRFGDEDNPLAVEAASVAGEVGLDFALEVVLNANGKVTGLFGGEPARAHQAALAEAAQALRAIDEPYDVVIAGSGSTARRTLAATLPALEAAAQATVPGGVVLLAADLSDGPGPPGYVDALTAGGSPANVLAQVAALDTRNDDAWASARHAQLAQRTRLCVHATAGALGGGLYVDEVKDINAAVAELAASGRALVLPDASAVIPAGP